MTSHLKNVLFCFFYIRNKKAYQGLVTHVTYVSARHLVNGTDNKLCARKEGGGRVRWIEDCCGLGQKSLSDYKSSNGLLAMAWF